jgi:hypothetical protein
VAKRVRISVDGAAPQAECKNMVELWRKYGNSYFLVEEIATTARRLYQACLMVPLKIFNTERDIINPL